MGPGSGWSRFVLVFECIVRSLRGLVSGVLVAILLGCRRWLLFGLFVYGVCRRLW